MPDEIHGGYEEMENGDEDMVNGIEDLRSRLIEAIPLYSDRLYRPDQNYANNIGTASVEREGDAAGGSADSLSRPITIEVNKVGEKEARQERSSPDSTLEGFEQEALRRNLRIAQVVEDVAAGYHDEPGNDGNSDGSSSSPRDGEVSEPDGSGALQSSSNGSGPSHDPEQQSIETDPSSPQASGKGRHTGSKRKLPAPSESLLKRAPAKSPERKSSAKPPVRSPTTSANSA
uniref:Uncharacterized protein n=1 Tax=Steinernema glaseri TaxID=37863 RepID=A0A1I8A7P9_9BILA